MTLLRDKPDWRRKYTPEDGDLVRSFYVPALTTAVRYDRVTGYFGARSLVLAARGVEGLVINGGVMRLLVGMTLDEAHVQAILNGEAARNVIGRSFEVFPTIDPQTDGGKALELLAWMVAQGCLQVKFALPCDLQKRPVGGTAIFHEKTGIVEDKTGERVAFTGSINETGQGWTDNWESFSAYCSWLEPDRVADEEAAFAKLWADRATRALVVDVPTAFRDGLMRYLPDDDELPRRLIEVEQCSAPSKLSPDSPNPPHAPPEPLSVEERRRAAWTRIAEAALDPIGGDRVGEATSAVTPWPHQIRAYQRMWDNWPTRLLIADEVGLGKTIQAGLLLRQAWLTGRAKRILVLAPKSVCRQWQIELREKFNLSWPIYDGQKLCWRASPAREQIERPVARGDWSAEPFVIMSSHLARRRERRDELLSAEPWDLIVLDEAHHARRKGAGTTQEKGANALLTLMRALKDRTPSLLLLTATPLQVAAVELWDLLNLLGLPAEWTDQAFVRFFADLGSDAPSPEAFERLAALFRSDEHLFGDTPAEKVERVTGLSPIQARKVARALRDRAETPRRQLNGEQRRAALKLIRKTSPVAALVSRHTRRLLKRYRDSGLLDVRIADRQVEDRFIQLSPEERATYEAVEGYIRNSYDKASQSDRSAVGFVMTIYRRRMASSFHALQRTLENRLAGVVDDRRAEEDAADLAESGDDLEDEAGGLEREALRLEETDTIATLLTRVKSLSTDTKAMELTSLLRELREGGFAQVMVFTQFTDTLDMLRDHVIRGALGAVMCFSGRGGEVLSGGAWRRITREEVKRKFKAGDAEILLCTDAAAEGLNFQFCGALVNYDMPWNPMRVEQRIGRIDRLGQRYERIRIVNLHYANTVEADVYHALRQRIAVFEDVVGGLQPILNRLPSLIGQAVLAPGVGRLDADALLDAGSADLGPGLDLDDFADEDLTPPKRPEPALSLADLRAVLTDPLLLPPPVEAEQANPLDWNYRDPALPTNPVRVTLSPEFFDLHADDAEFWTPGSPAFPLLTAGR